MLSCQSISKSFGTKTLFQNLSLSIAAKDRVGLIGPNGAGKTTLLKILGKIETPDTGIVSFEKGLKIGYVPQSSDFTDFSVFEILIQAQGSDVLDYEKESAAKTWLSKLGFQDQNVIASSLSGGWKKRLSLGKALIQSPDLLLLDEPTNHLDLEGVYWLEKFLLREALTYVLVSHDRYFLENTTNRIIEIAPLYPEGMLSIDGSYAHFLAHKEQFLEGQLQQERSIGTKARKELAWLRAGVKARGVKSRSRTEEAHEVLEKHANLQARNQEKRAKIAFEATERQTRKLITIKNLSKKIGDKLLFQGLDLLLSPQTRIGLMGPNGSGKTTFLKILTEEILPDLGTIKKAEGLKIVYFDQHRMMLPENLSLKNALSPQGDYVSFRGQKIHVNGWCKRFLFSPDILELPISKLSGGERARIAIAHLMLEPADVLLLDEPTNDLDIATLETLEENLLEFPGALILITHDRCMLDRVCNQFLSFQDPNQPLIYSDYAQWEQAQKQPSKENNKPKPEKLKTPKVKLSYLEQREFDTIQNTIESLEKEVQLLNQSLMSDAIASNPQKLAELCSEIALKENQIEQLYIRWDTLDKILKGQ